MLTDGAAIIDAMMMVVDDRRVDKYMGGSRTILTDLLLDVVPSYFRPGLLASTCALQPLASARMGSACGRGPADVIYDKQLETGHEVGMGREGRNMPAWDYLDCELERLPGVPCWDIPLRWTRGPELRLLA